MTVAHAIPAKKIVRIISMSLALLSLGAILYIDLEIANRYNESDGKTRALFSMVEILEFSHKYNFLIPAGISIILVVLQIIWQKNFKSWDLLTLLLSSLAIAGILTQSWLLFI